MATQQSKNCLESSNSVAGSIKADIRVLVSDSQSGLHCGGVWACAENQK
jgi:hypothetical protein